MPSTTNASDVAPPNAAEMAMFSQSVMEKYNTYSQGAVGDWLKSAAAKASDTSQWQKAWDPSAWGKVANALKNVGPTDWWTAWGDALGSAHQAGVAASKAAVNAAERHS